MLGSREGSQRWTLVDSINEGLHQYDAVRSAEVGMRRVTTGVLHGVSTVGFIAHVLGGVSGMDHYNIILRLNSSNFEGIINHRRL